jgi:hypothetical protein
MMVKLLIDDDIVKKGFPIPAAVQAESVRYIVSRDIVGSFIEDKFIVTGLVADAVLYSEFKIEFAMFVTEQGESSFLKPQEIKARALQHNAGITFDAKDPRSILTSDGRTTKRNTASLSGLKRKINDEVIDIAQELRAEPMFVGVAPATPALAMEEGGPWGVNQPPPLLPAPAPTGMMRFLNL